MTELLLTVVAASFVGSLHCVGMCGSLVGFVAGASATGRGALWAHGGYHLGRLLTYTGLGLAAGSLGAALDLAGRNQGLSRLAAVVAGAVIVLWGLIMLAQALGVNFPGARWLARVSSGSRLGGLFQTTLVRIGKKPPAWRSTALGLASTLLPCGWLYGFAVLAAGTGSAVQGGLLMMAFWLGTVPALLGAGVVIRAAASVVGPRLGWIMPTLLIAMGVLTVFQREAMIGRAHAHHHAAPAGDAAPGEGGHGCH